MNPLLLLFFSFRLAYPFHDDLLSLHHSLHLFLSFPLLPFQVYSAYAFPLSFFSLLVLPSFFFFFLLSFASGPLPPRQLALYPREDIDVGEEAAGVHSSAVWVAPWHWQSLTECHRSSTSLLALAWLLTGTFAYRAPCVLVVRQSVLQARLSCGSHDGHHFHCRGGGRSTPVQVCLQRRRPFAPPLRSSHHRRRRNQGRRGGHSYSVSRTSSSLSRSASKGVPPYVFLSTFNLMYRLTFFFHIISAHTETEKRLLEWACIQGRKKASS